MDERTVFSFRELDPGLSSGTLGPDPRDAIRTNTEPDTDFS